MGLAVAASLTHFKAQMKRVHAKTKLAPQRTFLHRCAGALWPQKFQDRLGSIAAVQREFSQQAAQVCADALLGSFVVGTQRGRSARARLLSCDCRPASAWLDTLPLASALELKSGEAHSGLHHRLGISTQHSNATPTPPIQCDCGARLCHTYTEHGMRCPSLAAHTTLRHDILKGVLQRVVPRPGIASTL
jgi:hypothetical protein